VNIGYRNSSLAMLGSVPPIVDCVLIRKSCHSGRAMGCIARSVVRQAHYPERSRWGIQ